MIKRIVFVFIIFFFSFERALAQDIPVQVKSLSKISTSNINLQEGDTINFVVADNIYVKSKLYFKANESVQGIITSLNNNTFACQEASIYAENFSVKNVNGENISLKGIIYKKGRNHALFAQFVPVLYIFIRGGEAQILPQKDTFTLYIGDL